MTFFSLNRAQFGSRVRLQMATSVLLCFYAAGTYAASNPATAQSNAEMQRICDEDQVARQGGFNIDWAVVDKADAARRDETLVLLKRGALHTGEDYNRAALVFQHGSTPNDFLVAHTLALIALKKGDAGSIWIATATLDRYLQSVHQPQIYGTQFRTVDKNPTTQDPYDRLLMGDAVRKELNVPSLEEQDRQREQYDKQRGIEK